MNLIEALKTGKPIRKQGHSEWHLYDLEGMMLRMDCINDPDQTFHQYSQAEILADDWEVEPEKSVTVTKARILKAWEFAFSHPYGKPKMFDDSLDLFLLDLGLD